MPDIRLVNPAGKACCIAANIFQIYVGGGVKADPATTYWPYLPADVLSGNK